MLTLACPIGVSNRRDFFRQGLSGLTLPQKAKAALKLGVTITCVTRRLCCCGPSQFETFDLHMETFGPQNVCVSQWDN